MQNDAGEFVDLYIPRKCSLTNRLIGATDYAAVQFNVGHVSEDGLYTKEYTTFTLCGALRKKGDADAALEILAKEKGLI